MIVGPFIDKKRVNVLSSYVFSVTIDVSFNEKQPSSLVLIFNGPFAIDEEFFPNKPT